MLRRCGQCWQLSRCVCALRPADHQPVAHMAAEHSAAQVILISLILLWFSQVDTCWAVATTWSAPQSLHSTCKLLR